MHDPLVVWAAGFFDGEGCVLLIRQNRDSDHVGSIRLGIAVGQKVREPLDDLAERWGGTVRQFSEPRGNRAAKFDWRLHGAAAVAFLHDIRPYLRVKHRQAEVGIRWGETIDPTRSRPYGVRGLPDALRAIRESLFVELRLLNRRGPVS